MDNKYIRSIHCAGIRGSKTTIQDLQETVIAVERAIDLETQRVKSVIADG